MSILTLFTRNAPTLNGFEFDAILEDTFDAAVEYTSYPIESGARASDHGIITPFRWRLIGAVSNNPIRPVLSDFTGVFSNLAENNGVVAGITGLSAGLISGSNDTRSSETLSFLINLMSSRQPFDVYTGNINLVNMVIATLQSIKTPADEGGLIFDAQLQELPTLDTLTSDEHPNQNQLRDNTPEKSQLAGLIDLGQKTVDDVNTAVEDFITGLF